jgi:translation initiation factor eIF-2B subunit beta
MKTVGRETFRKSSSFMLQSSSSFLSESALSMFAMEEVDEVENDYSEPYNIKQPVLEAIRTFIDDLAELHASISQQALDHIHEHEVVLTFGRSKTVLEFLKAASRKRTFSVIVAESAPSFEGRHTAMLLSKEGIKTTVVTDSAVFALMSRVNKVIIGVRAVLANGGLLAHSGAYLIAMAAKAHHVPLVVLSGLYKFTPLYPSEDQDTFADMGPPNRVLPFGETDMGHEGDVLVKNPSYDYVPPTHVSLFISNQGGIMPPYIYQILAEFYHPDDLPELNGPLNITLQSKVK